jgi:hypothetical protein
MSYYGDFRRPAKVALQADQATSSSYKRRNAIQKQHYGIYGQRANDFSIQLFSI